MLRKAIEIVFIILSLYPIIGAICWIIGALCYKFLYRHDIKEFKELDASEEPFVTIMVPAHNEEVMIEQTINYLMNEIKYTQYEVLVMDDGSSDRTPEILARLCKVYKNLRVVRIEKNKGKAHAFNIGLAFAKGEFILSNDADTVPEPDALWKYMNYFMSEEGRNIAAVTANMDVQNRSKLIEKSQTVEFSSIVGAIKRGQMGVLGTMYAYSGANTMYRKTAIIDAGLFRQDRATEDISICWDQQFGGWRSIFAPEIMFYMNVPSSLKMLYRQRKRWAQGGIEVWLTNFKKTISHPIKNMSQIIMLIDQTYSIVWSFLYVITMVIFNLAALYFIMTQNYIQVLYMFEISFIYITFQMIAGLGQLIIALILDNKGRKLKYLLFAPFYMLLFWKINALTIVMTFIPAIKTILGFGSGVWKSPDRVKMMNS